MMLGAIRFILVLIALPLAAQEYLQTKDIHKIMDQILEQHVEQKNISSSILKHSFQIYIDQFDPDRTYLLESEIKPFIDLSDAEMAEVAKEYKANDFKDYADLNAVIQRAILRSRNVREKLEKNQPQQLFQRSLSINADMNSDWTDPDLKKHFPKNEAELYSRIQHNIVDFIARERKRYGDSYIRNRELQTLKIYEKEMQHHENQYLYVNEAGVPMTAQEKENAFSLHVLKSLANSLDAHTTVLDSTEAYDMRVRLEKEMEGVGIEVQKGSGGLFFVRDLVRGGPADKSGNIKLDDQIIEINGIKLERQSIAQVMELLHGKPGTKVHLVLERTVDERGEPVDKTFNVDLVRESIHLNEDRVKVSSEKFEDGIIGVIKLDTFYQNNDGINSENDVRDAIENLDAKGNLRGLILDLRENSGGFLSQAVKVAGLFITNGVIVVSKYFNGEEHFYRDVDSKKLYGGPFIVLTSKATASAAEIVAQALQDYGIAVIVGDEHTYGKGTIQSQTVTENDAPTFFKVTVGKYYTVSGKTPQIQGVKADVVVPSKFLHEKLGEAYLDSTIKESDTIPPAFDDHLEDISPNLKSWYMHYYVPTLQHKSIEWQNYLPQLKKNSQVRMSSNKPYQAFIKGSAKNDDEDIDDLQLKEAENILKDMISIHSQSRTNGN